MSNRKEAVLGFIVVICALLVIGVIFLALKLFLMGGFFIGVAIAGTLVAIMSLLRSSSV